jgi:hypothetical protein
MHQCQRVLVVLVEHLVFRAVLAEEITLQYPMVVVVVVLLRQQAQKVLAVVVVLVLLVVLVELWLVVVGYQMVMHIHMTLQVMEQRVERREQQS